MIYRALTTLDTGKRIIPNGAIFPESYLSDKAKTVLEANEMIAPAVLPPLVALPQMKSKALRLGKVNIVETGDFLEADDGEIAKILRISEKEVRLLKDSLYAFFTPPKASP